MTKFSILATGTIAHKMAKTIREMPQVQLYAVGSRSQEKADEFKDEYNFQVAYGSYEELAKDSQSDIIYVATPHSHHYENVKMLLLNDHHVLCEKPITVNQKQAIELYSLAKERNLLLADATWSRYMPFSHIVKEAAKNYELGKLKMIHSNFGIQKLHAKRMVDPNLAGGALLDLGIYPLNNALMFADSKVVDIETSMVKHTTGVDESNIIVLTFENGVKALLSSSMNCIMDTRIHLSYENGRIELDALPNPTKYSIYDEEQELLFEEDLPPQISGYEYQVEEMIQVLQQNKTEMISFTIDESLEVMKLLDTIRSKWNLVYPFE